MRSKLIPCGGMQTLTWNGYSADENPAFLGVLLEVVEAAAAAASASASASAASSSGVHVSQRSF